MAIERLFHENRPPNFIGKGDKYLPRIIAELNRLLAKEINSFAHDAMKVEKEERQELATIIVEFAEDIYNDIGFWSSYERFNEEHFGMPLPPFTATSSGTAATIFTSERLQHLLHVVYEEFKPDVLIPPTNRDLEQLARRMSEFLEREFRNKPMDSGIQKFLSQPDHEAGDVKKKLIWTGTKSYLFRLSFKNYLKAKGQAVSIPTIDDFVCQQNTKLSGLGAIDILSDVLEITDDQRKDLKSWYERHLAYYQILRIEGKSIEALNVINGRKYLIGAGEFASLFDVDTVVLGGLLPWDGLWYWSGQQENLGHLSEEEIAYVKKDLLEKNAAICYRYHTEMRKKAMAGINRHYKAFVEFFGDNMVTFPDGLSMASAMQRKERLTYESKMSRKQLSKFMKKHDLKNVSPTFSYPEELIDSTDGVGVFFNPQEGQEIMRRFDEAASGFEKNGVDLSEDEKDVIRSFIESSAISPKFVNRMIEKYGYASILSSFIVRNGSRGYVDYLLRKYKGHFYRNRYPSLSFVE